MQEQSRKYMRFHIQCRTYQFKAVPFGLSTAPMEFTVVTKEVKLMAIHSGIRIHQYLDDWLVRASSYQTCLRNTQELVEICQKLGWVVNFNKSELEPKQVVQLRRLPVRLQVRSAEPSTIDTGTSIPTGFSGPAVHVPDRSANCQRKKFT